MNETHPSLKIACGRGLPQILAFAFVVLSTPLFAQDYGNNKPRAEAATAVPLTPEQKTLLEAVDIRIGGIEALLPRLDDEKFKASTLAAIADLKKRRTSLGRNFDQGLYEALMHQVIGRYQVVQLWLKPPRVPAPAEKSSGAARRGPGTKVP